MLLRGINLGARNRIAMAELRELFASAGYDGVRTYLQSGNLVLSAQAPALELAAESERLIQAAFGMRVGVIVRTRDELAAVVERDPLGATVTDPKRYQVSFLAGEIGDESIARLNALAVAPEQLVANARELYSWHPDGVGRSKLAIALASANLGVLATARNWRTVTSLLELADEAATPPR